MVFQFSFRTVSHMAGKGLTLFSTRKYLIVASLMFSNSYIFFTDCLYLLFLTEVYKISQHNPEFSIMTPGVALQDDQGISDQETECCLIPGQNEKVELCLRDGMKDGFSQVTLGW